MKPFPYLALIALCVTARADVVINELMYHPQSENVAEEFIELHNTGGAPVDVSGWKFTSGVNFTIPAATSIPAGGYLVVAADAVGFAAKYPAVTNFVAGWTGRLSNSSNNVTLENALGATMDRVEYSDDGDWGERRRQDPPDFGHRGWKWFSEADGSGKTLELIHAAFDNNIGQNWAVSTVVEGTPGAVNSVAVADIAPVIDNAEHFPLAPTSSEMVTVICRVRDDLAITPTVQVHYRDDGAGSFIAAPMFDDGAHDDALAGDGIFGAQLPARPNGTVVEFYFEASDGALSRTWPAPARDYTSTMVQTQNCLYQVSNTSYAGAAPLYRFVMRAADRTELSNINTDTGTPPFPFNPGEDPDQTHSHARFNATFISNDGTGPRLNYRVSLRNRGNGSRSAQPQSFNVGFPNADTWNGFRSLNLNTQNTPYQLFGSALFRQAGLAGPESRAVQVRVNGADPTGGTTAAPSYGFYVCNEVQNSDFADHHFPLDSGGNIYRAQRFVTGLTAGGTELDGANLESIVPAVGETLSLVDLYKLNYRKETNESEDNWSDFIALTAALAKGHNGATVTSPTTYDADYVASVQAKADVAQWMRWFAVNAMADNEETNLSNGDGDDYYLYLGQTDVRAKLVPFDLDTILGRSGTSNSATHGIFRMTDAPDGTPTPVNPFMKHPDFAPLYYAELIRLLDGVFLPANFDPLCDQILAGAVGAATRSSIKTFNATRHAHVTTLVPRALSVTASQTTGGAALTVVNGYPQSTAAACRLIGRAHASDTRSVKVDGIAATWSAWQAQWTADGIALTPGVNRILVQAFDGNGTELQRTHHSVWFNDGSETTAPASIASDTTWTAAAGPYRVTAALSIASGATLTIEPGTVVYLNAGTGIDFTVASGGRLLAEGTAAQPIRFMAAPGGANWGGIIINGAAGTPQTRMAHVFIEGNSDDAIDVNGADVALDYLEFGNRAVQYLSLDGAAFVVSNCTFPTPTAAFEPVHGSIGVRAGGVGIIRDCFFGKAQGYNDVIDFTGGNRPAPILQIINNVFAGSDDDILDIDGTDTWVEGNIFMHVHRNGSPDSASAVSGGSDSGSTSHITVVGNLFFDVDQAATAKQGNFYTFLNNTVVDQNGRGSEDVETGVLNFSDDGTTAGAGIYLEGNIIHSAAELVRNYSATDSAVTFNNNLLPMAWTGPGSGNTVGDALLVAPFDIPTPNDNNWRQLLPEIRAAFAPQSCSPALGTGPNGTDKGGVRALGVSLGGAPVGTTNSAAATLTVGTLMIGSGIPATANAFPAGSGWTHYQWRLDGGAWSAETPLATPIALAGLADGTHTVEAVGRNDAGTFQNDAALGTSARVTSATWTVDSAYVPPPAALAVRINEVLASNIETLLFGSNAPDIIELHNPSTSAVSLAGWGLTDNASLPFKYTFPAGTTIAAGGYLVVYASGSGSVPQPKTGFGLGREGDDLTLTRSAAAGGGVADVIVYGNQLSDFSIGRCADGSWELCRPTFGSANRIAATGDVRDVVINEWLADAAVLAAQDFIELHNPATLPVDIGLGFLTDNPSDWPQRHQIRQLTFIAPGGYIFFKADDDAGQGPEHVNFKLEALQGELGFFDAAGALVDNIVYGPQRTDVSEGRTPNGARTIAAFTQPTPGGPNPGVAGTATSTIALIPVNAAWKYRSSATDFSATFFDPLFDDTAWASGGQLLYVETSTLTSPSGFVKTTALPVDAGNSNRPFNATYFRAHFTYAGPLTDVTLQAKVMLDDGAVFYLNGHEITPTGGNGNRLRMPAGTVTFATIATSNIDNASEETLTFDATWLQQGDNVFAVAVHQEHSGATQSSSDVVFGVKLDALVTIGAASSIVLNEVLPINATLPNPDSSLHGWIELHNTAATAVDLADFSLSDETEVPRKYVFPAGTSIPAGGYLVLQCDASAPASATNTGFAPGGDGGVVLLFNSLALGGGLHDSVAYGRQIADFAIGRTPDGTGPWALTVPTRGALNSAAGTGPITSVRLNEWRISGGDFLELRNLDALPVALGGAYLTDLLTNKTKFPIPALSYIGGSGPARWQVWAADNDNGGTPGHLNFALETTDALGFFSGAGITLDSTPALGSISAGTSAGRYPEGTSAILTLIPTPGAANQPLGSDTDADGMSDLYELANGFNPIDPADGALDADSDGQSNAAESIAGTNPRDPYDVLRAELVRSGGQPVVRFTASIGRTYTVQWKTALPDAVWQKLADVPASGVPALIEVPDPTATGDLTRFYRVITPAQP